MSKSSTNASLSPAPGCRQTFTIEGWLPAPVTNAGHHHWAKVRRQTDWDKATVWSYAKHAGIQKVDGPAILNVTFVFGSHRRRDTDNLYARAKYVVDALKPWIVDDSQDWLELHVTASVQKGRKATICTLERKE